MKISNKNARNITISFPKKLSLAKQNQAKILSTEAILNNKIFMIQGPYSEVRNCLRERGWVEKFYNFSIHKKAHLNNEKDEEDEDLDYNDTTCQPPWKEDDGFYAYLHRLVVHNEPNLLWGIRKDSFNSQFVYNHQLLNHFANSMFTTKVGLNSHLQDSHWHEAGYYQSFYPRVYQLVKVDEKTSFQIDFIQTACVSLLKIIYSNNAENIEKLETHETLPEIFITNDIFTQAFNTCAHQVSFMTHNDIDASHPICPHDFQQLLTTYYSVRRYKGPVSVNDLSLRLNQISNVLNQLRQLSPQYGIDGIRNVWILKPGAKSRGRGVLCLDTLEDIMNVVQNHMVTNEKKYVLQKYIESPLLVYETKFDIRQWFLVTDWNPLTVWLYKDAYLRFCSKQYSLDNLDLAIHLTNNSIQKNCVNQDDRSSLLPEENMWTSQQLDTYLQQERGNVERWEDTIYQGMKDAILTTMHCCQGDVKHRKNSFELYGADFILDEDHHPWLLEINSSPCMTHSTHVTAYMCPRVIQDTFKVVLDYKEDKKADTGRFELICKQNAVVVPNHVGLSMQVKGETIQAPLHPIGSPFKRNSKKPSAYSSLMSHTREVLKDCRQTQEHLGRRNKAGNFTGKGLFDALPPSLMLMVNNHINKNNSNANNNGDAIKEGLKVRKVKSKATRLRTTKSAMAKEKESVKKEVHVTTTNLHMSVEPAHHKLQKNRRNTTNLPHLFGEIGERREVVRGHGERVDVEKDVGAGSVGYLSTQQRSKLQIDCSSFDDAGLCDRIVAHMQQFQKELTHDKPLCHSRLFPNSLLPTSEPRKVQGNWSAVNKPQEHKPSLTRPALPTPLPQEDARRHRSRLGLGFKQVALETPCPSTPLRWLLKGINVPMLDQC